MVVLCSVRLSAICLYAVWALSAPVPAQGMGRHLLAAKKAERIHIFVGGSHFSGANTIEKILSSQYMASGFRTEWTTVKSTAGCLMPSQSAEFPSMCHAPENEGVFLTQAFSTYYIKQARPSCLSHSSLYWGECAQSKSLTKADVKRAGGSSFKIKLMADWGQWWNMSKPYLVEKDVSNMVKGQFLQELFGAGSTVFVFTLRHPLQACHDLKCDVVKTVETWLLLHELMRADLTTLEHHIVVQYEQLFITPGSILEAISQVIGWEKIEVIDNTHIQENRSSYGTVMQQSSGQTQMMQQIRAARHSERHSWQAPKPKPSEIGSTAKIVDIPNVATRTTSTATNTGASAARSNSFAISGKRAPAGSGRINIPSSTGRTQQKSRVTRKAGDPLQGGRGSGIKLPTRNRGEGHRRLRSKDDKEPTSTAANNGGWGGWLFGVSKPNKPRTIGLSRDEHVSLISLQEPYAVSSWKNKYPGELTKRSKILDSLLQFEARLAQFCYSIYSLEPKPFLCKDENNNKINELRNRGIYSMSESASPLVKDQNKFYHVPTTYSPFGTTQKRSTDSLKKRYIVRNKLNESEAVARNEKFFQHDERNKRFSHMLSPEDFAKNKTVRRPARSELRPQHVVDGERPAPEMLRLEVASKNKNKMHNSGDIKPPGW